MVEEYTVEVQKLRGLLGALADTLVRREPSAEECSEAIDLVLHRLARRLAPRVSPAPYTREQWINLLRGLVQATTEYESAGTPEKAWTFALIVLGGALSGEIDLAAPPPTRRHRSTTREPGRGTLLRAVS